MTYDTISPLSQVTSLLMFIAMFVPILMLMVHKEDLRNY